MNQIAYLTVASVGNHDDNDWPPEDAVGFVSWFADKLATIPQEYRAAAKVVISSDSYWDSSQATIEITYQRPETDDEARDRERKERQRKDDELRRDFAQFERLKSKLGQ